MEDKKTIKAIAIFLISLILVIVLTGCGKKENTELKNITQIQSTSKIENTESISSPAAMPELWDWNVWNNSLDYIVSNAKNLSKDYLKFTFDGNEYSLYTLKDFIEKELQEPYINNKTEYNLKYKSFTAGIFSFRYDYYEGIENEIIHRPTNLYMQVSFDGSWFRGEKLENMGASYAKYFKDDDNWFNIFNPLYLKNGVTIGQTESEVIKILGEPTESYLGDDEGDVHDTFTVYQDENITINNKCDFDKGRLTIITIHIKVTNIPVIK